MPAPCRLFFLRHVQIKPIYTDDKVLSALTLSPDGKYLTFRLVTVATGNRGIIVPNYVTRSGYVEDIPGRTNVGERPATSDNFVYNVQKDSLYKIQIDQIPGIRDLPDYVKDYPKQLADRQKANELRNISLGAVSWNEAGTVGIVSASSVDNKDAWILKVNGSTGALTLLDRQRDEAWIGGPGNGGNGTWIDNDRFFFKSEATGYAHLYLYNV
ncbi:MAG: S9 family peptidase, partial [Sphingobacteriales bacterium]